MLNYKKNLRLRYYSIYNQLNFENKTYIETKYKTLNILIKYYLD